MIRPAVPTDHPAIARINAEAFGGPDEARLVGHLRADGEVLVELVVEEEGAVVGHILFSRLPIVAEGREAVRATALAPVAVSPARQRAGLGSALIVAGLEACRALGVPAVVVLGHADFYPRFGFSPATAAGLEAPFSGPHFMALEMFPGALAHGGRVIYAKAFGL
jgi:putative acetyltransferase